MTDPATFARADRAYVVAAAGCGKTQLITEALKENRHRHQLVLTHTNAGVAALRARIRRAGIPYKAVQVETITGFALRYASAYPKTSGVRIDQPTGSDWPRVVDGALRVLDTRAGRDVVRSSFDGLYVDEHQDCSEQLHSVIRTLADVIPTRIVGDPLQGIFGFRGQRLVDWDVVDSEFERLPDLTTPWRWAQGNRALGEWLVSIRPELEGGRWPVFDGAPISFTSANTDEQVAHCMRLRDERSVVAVRQWKDDAHEFARRLQGSYTSMEEVECTALLQFAARLDRARGMSRSNVTLAFAESCISGLDGQFDAIRDVLRGRIEPSDVPPGIRRAALAFKSIAESASPQRVRAALAAVAELPGAEVFRRELLLDAIKTVRLATVTRERSIAEVAWLVRDRTRKVGRPAEGRVVSRTLLVKGLEFDHAVVLDARDWPGPAHGDMCHLYVAMTRGKHSLTVLA